MVIELLGDSAIDIIIEGADRILGEVGIQVDDAETLDHLSVAGATVHPSGRVRWAIGAAREVLATAPRSFELQSRNPALSVRIGGAGPVFAPVYGPPNVIDDHGARRPATMADYTALVRIASDAAGLQTTGHMICVPSDVDEPERDDVMARAHLAISDKPFMGTTANEDATRSVIELTAAAFTASGIAAPGCRLLHLCNSIPPLTWRSRMLGVLRASGSSGQGTVVASFQMLGATGPVSVLGALSQGLAEVVVGAALTQLYRPGAPVVMGIYAIPFDMRSMLPRFGDPISAFVQSGSAQLARRLGVPALGYGGVTSSKVDDAQAGFESAGATRIAVDSGADFVLHAAGWLENGRTVSFAKFRREAATLQDHAGSPALDQQRVRCPG
jgi:trimethylamine--corrinoid protein Co-methyltransferase